MNAKRISCLIDRLWHQSRSYRSYHWYGGISFLVILVLSMTSCSHHHGDSTDISPIEEVLLADLPSGTTSVVPVLPTPAFEYVNIALPAHFRVANGRGQNAVVNTDNTPRTNPLTNDGATLGRVLFYDNNLSFNRTTACASCHNQSQSFTDSNRLSKGFLGGLTRRHSMSLANARYFQSGRFFWDERAATLETQVLMPFQDATEMGMTLPLVVERIREQTYYPALFQKAFGTTTITADLTARALAQFVRSMVSANSKYDVGRSRVATVNTDFPNFTASENNGKRLFLSGRGNCSGCHATEAHIANNPTNNGVDAVSTTDLGVFETTRRPQDLGAFKVPSLRDIAVTAPYMHDGRFSTLEQVVEHYNSGIRPHTNLDRRLRDNRGQPIRMNLSQQEKQDLVAFLRTLTDLSFLNDVKFSNPFRVR